MTAPVISKSRYLAGLQCPKLLWHHYNAKDLLPAPDAAKQAIFDQGHLVGARARNLFPGGVLLDRNALDPQGMIEETARVLPLGKPVFEAAFSAGGAYAQVDMLVPGRGGSWDIVEVKSAASVKPIHFDDLALQRHAAAGAGLRVGRCVLAHLDRSYVRRGEIDDRALFVLADVSEEVERRLPGVRANLESMAGEIALPGCPAITVGPQCDAPYECPLKSLCWDFLPEENVTQLTWGGARVRELLEAGIFALRDIPGDFPLNHRQKIQVRAARSGEVHLDRERVTAFLRQLRYPLSFLDFETMNPAIPLFDGASPYQQIPFQFSLHVQHEPGGTLDHREFLAEGGGDPRPELLRRLSGDLGETGSIVAFSASFERSVISRLAGDFPAHRPWANAVLPRFADLLTPFKNFHLYHPAQRGSASMKAVLPAFTGRGYDDLSIADGDAASREYLRITLGEGLGEGERVGEEERQRVRAALRDYCRLDSEGMALIVEEMRRLAGS
jgi:hypothetical protein